MNKRILGKKLAVSALAFTIWVVPIAAIGQTRVTAPKNKYKLQDDIKLGNDAAAEIDRQFPILNDADATRYVTRVGDRLVASIPPQFRQPSFDYRFKVVNARDINAFSLPGGPMYINRGMIEAANNEGEMAGVMAHEISHVALRHATAQATKQGSFGSQLGMLGMILGGAILGGQTGAQLGAMGAAAWMTKYSRAYETQADTLGAQIMANAGYDPRDLANMFRTIAGERSGGGAPEWLSSHPDPGNRFETINREASLLRVSPNPIKITRDFERVQARLRAMPRAKSMAEIEKDVKSGSQNPTASGKYSNNVQYPSSNVRSYSSGSWIRLNVPSNWREFSGTSQVQFAPEGAYGEQGITHGAMIGIYRGSANNIAQDSESFVNGMLEGNSYLQKSSNYSQAYVGGRQGRAITLSGRSLVTGRTEVVTIYTTLLRSGDLFYAATVVPDNESTSYYNAFRNMLNSIRISEQ